MKYASQLAEGGAARFYRGNEIACLLTHGFMAYPTEVAWLADYLAAQGYTVYVQRLAGHGVQPEAMRRVRMEDWLAQTEDAYAMLAANYQQVYAIGHSMGGLLSAILASHKPLRGLVMVASPVLLTSPLVPYARLIDVLQPYTYHESEPELVNAIESEQKRRGEQVIGRTNYRKWSSRAVYEFYRVMNTALDCLPQINVPLCLINAKQDPTAPPFNADVIAAKVQSKLIKRHLLEEGAHIVLQDVGREAAFQAVGDFIKEVQAL